MSIVEAVLVVFQWWLAVAVVVGLLIGAVIGLADHRG